MPLQYKLLLGLKCCVGMMRGLGLGQMEAHAQLTTPAMHSS